MEHIDGKIFIQSASRDSKGEKKRRILILEILINVGWNESVDRIAR